MKNLPPCSAACPSSKFFDHLIFSQPGIAYRRGHTCSTESSYCCDAPKSQPLSDGTETPPYTPFTIAYLPNFSKKSPNLSMVPLETNYWTDLHQILRISYISLGMINPIFSRSFKGCCNGNRFIVRICENWHNPPSFRALTFYTGWEDRNKDARVNTADDPSSSAKNVVNHGPGPTPEFCRGVCVGRATRWALPYISTYYCNTILSTA